MPRIKPAVLREASRLHRLLPLLLPECRTIPNAQQELRWIQNEVRDEKRIRRCCELRALHYPLQYLLGSQPFGPLDIACRPGVLIPRWETEEWASELAHRLPKETQLVTMDLCTGTGCIPLLIKHVRSQAAVYAVDVSPHAYQLALKNSQNLCIPIQICQANILKEYPFNTPHHVDLITCNPPYIDRPTYVTETARSVRLFEPKLALLGNEEFYENLVQRWLHRTDAFVYEVGDISQCEFVLSQISNSPDLASTWQVGFKEDSRKQARVVFGYRKQGSKLDWTNILKDFGQLKY